MLTPQHKPKAIILDVDKTLTERVTWYELTEKLGGDTAEHARLFSSYLGGKLSYEEMKSGLFKMWNQHGQVTKEQLKQIFTDVHLKGEALAVFGELQERGHQLCLISSSIDMFTEIVAKRFNIDYWYANSELVFDENDNWIDFHFDKRMAELKVKQLENYLNRTHLKKTDCVAIGDDTNDAGLFREIPGIAVNTNNDLINQMAWKSVAYLPRVIQVIESIPA